MRFQVEMWAPDFGAPFEDMAGESDAATDPGVEVAASLWQPISPPPETPPAAECLFIDGVRAVDARVWIASSSGTTEPGICATFAAGVVRCDGRATIVSAEVRRGLFTPSPEADAIGCGGFAYPIRRAGGATPEELALALQSHMGALEQELAAAQDGAFVVVDGPLSGRQWIPGAIGYVKTHHTRYIPDELCGVVAALGPGQRTPVVLVYKHFSRYTWYMRLPGANGHPWAGVVRCEVTGDREVASAASLADVATATLPRFASEAHKDPRAPQNLYPIAGLERELRRRLGDPHLKYRALRKAAAAASSAP